MSGSAGARPRDWNPQPAVCRWAAGCAPPLSSSLTSCICTESTRMRARTRRSGRPPAAFGACGAVFGLDHLFESHLTGRGAALSISLPLSPLCPPLVVGKQMNHDFHTQSFVHTEVCVSLSHPWKPIFFQWNELEQSLQFMVTQIVWIHNLTNQWRMQLLFFQYISHTVLFIRGEPKHCIYTSSKLDLFFGGLMKKVSCTEAFRVDGKMYCTEEVKLFGLSNNISFISFSFILFMKAKTFYWQVNPIEYKWEGTKDSTDEWAKVKEERKRILSILSTWGLDNLYSCKVDLKRVRWKQTQGVVQQFLKSYANNCSVADDIHYWLQLVNLTGSCASLVQRWRTEEIRQRGRRLYTVEPLDLSPGLRMERDAQGALHVFSNPCCWHLDYYRSESSQSGSKTQIYCVCSVTFPPLHLCIQYMKYMYSW